ncbi:5-(carboxyamino)imidazole ribonucleotide synthase [Lentilitoribacter sp. EG35]|uniref:5-(carboxyamino)imidazole ribonucleotide synthase n=1 Tax=Lentilitoribacter sp. EG35 TaxID=3234192 RepID=UPI00345F603F
MNTNTLKPNSTIGIIGGGQLGRMLAMAAAQLGFKTIILEPDPNAPAAQVANDQIMAAYDDEIALESLSQQCDVITYEFENVPASAVEMLEDVSKVYPGSKALKISQDRLLEKENAVAIGATPAKFFKVNTIDDLRSGLKEIGYPAILKTRRMGYDGKGQMRIDSDNDVIEAFGAMNGQDAILEAFISFSCEVSVIAARSQDGTFSSFDIAENVHKNHILDTSTIPAKIHDNVAIKATEIAKKIADNLDYVGVFAVEFFVEDAKTANFSLYVNEIAPRVHNSGHWTEAACAVSQFEQHIRAISGLTLGDPSRHSDCIMRNLIGDDVNDLPALCEKSNAKIHLYGKLEARAGRKMGHVTYITPKS